MHFKNDMHDSITEDLYLQRWHYLNFSCKLSLCTSNLASALPLISVALSLNLTAQALSMSLLKLLSLTFYTHET
jgi:hypothetical protein